jgi:hypothetical protein
VNRPNTHHLTIFLVSLCCISLELFLTRILNLKTWNHVIYTVIPFAMLGFGIGANLVLIWKDTILRWTQNVVTGSLLLGLTLLGLACPLLIKILPIHIDSFLQILISLKAIEMMLLAYTVFMIPFIIIGFLIVYLFCKNPDESHTLYGVDLLGAGVGACLFFPLINTFAVFHSLGIISFACFLMGLYLLIPKNKIIFMSCCTLLFITAFHMIPEPADYAIDPKKGWEWIPNMPFKNGYELTLSRWHPLGRTDLYRINAQEKVYDHNPGTFEINLDPRPDYSYFTTNFLAGTPVYELSTEGMLRKGSHIKPFSCLMEVAYTLVENPKVFIIGVGGGRDIFMGLTHGAHDIVGAEVNPGIVKEMSPGGKAFDYSGQIYTRNKTKVYAEDGRSVVKKLKPGSLDLIILNRVDTFSGLSSGAYAYAESYLYTKNAFEDYLKVLKDNGVINVYRWAFPQKPREELRLFAIALAALKSSGIQNPWDHIVIGGNGSVFLIKKTAFSAAERTILKNYFTAHHSLEVYPPETIIMQSNGPLMAYQYYVDAFKENKQRLFEKIYPFDISVITDDNPFFYKYYKFNPNDLLKPNAEHHTGSIIFFIQTFILIQSIVFIVLFILFPLILFKKRAIQMMPRPLRTPFILFFSCLGLGFMFVEISFMQHFVLLLGSPIYSISVVLTLLLMSSGLGSFALPHLERLFKRPDSLLTFTTWALAAYLAALILVGTNVFDHFMNVPFWSRIFLVALLIGPAGFLLGIFFPSGLRLISQNYQESVTWAWGLNCGFSVLGSILSIITAQFLGFNFVLVLSCGCYVVALLAFRQMTLLEEKSSNIWS